MDEKQRLDRSIHIVSHYLAEHLPEFTLVVQPEPPLSVTFMMANLKTHERLTLTVNCPVLTDKNITPEILRHKMAEERLAERLRSTRTYHWDPPLAPESLI